MIVNAPPGGADKIALTANNEIYLLTIDGSDFDSLTSTKLPKFDLQWLSDGKTLLYVTGKTVKTIDTETRVEEIITNFASAEYFEAMHKIFAAR